MATYIALRIFDVRGQIFISFLSFAQVMMFSPKIECASLGNNNCTPFQLKS